MYLDAAQKLWKDCEYGNKDFKRFHLLEILKECPKFVPMTEVQEVMATNPVGQVMGMHLDKPIGCKAAKKQKLLDKLDQSSIAATKSSKAFEDIALAQMELARTVEKSRQDRKAKDMELARSA